jgi:hypothetical protein
MKWGEKPTFPNAPEDSERALWSRRCVISSAVAIIGACIFTWGMDFWPTITVFVLLVIAFDAGDHRALFGDEPETFEIVETENGPVHRPYER